MATTSNITNAIPWEVTTSHILSRLNSRELCKFNLVSKSAQNILNYMATQPQEDITIVGEKVFFVCDGTFPDLLRQKIKMEILATLPPPPAFLGRAQAQMLKKLGITWQPTCDHETLEFNVRRFEIIDTYTKHAKKHFGPLFVLFDFHTKLLDANLLEEFLAKAIQYDQFSFIPAILLGHTNAKNIPGKGTANDYGFCDIQTKNSHGNGWYTLITGLGHGGGLGLLLQFALNTYQRTDEDKLKLVKLLFSHPNGNDIPVLDLQKVMMYTVKGGVRSTRFYYWATWNGGSPEVLKAIFSHRNAINIPANGVNSLASALGAAKAIGNPKMIEVVRSHPNAKDIHKDCSIM